MSPQQVKHWFSVSEDATTCCGIGLIQLAAT